MNQHRPIPIKFIYTQGKEQIRFVNQFAISQIDMDVVIDVAVVDLKQVLELNQKVQSNTAQPEDILEAFVVQRAGMSINSFVKLKHQIDQIFENLEKQGVLIKKPETGQLQ